MNGAESLVRTLIDAGVEVCFANPGTSEMHFVAALDRVGGIRCVLGLFEGVVTGAADGYARMLDKPAVTLLHLGPGLGNGLANLHNARKASTSIVNIVGEHASWHIEFDAPLTADIEGIARPVSHWVKTAESATDVARDGAAAVVEAMTYPGRIATLILPANTAWEESNGVAPIPSIPSPPEVSASQITSIVKVLSLQEPTAFILSGACVRAAELEIASAIAQKSGADLFLQTSNARIERGVGRVYVKPIPYAVDEALKTLQPYKHIITVCANKPVAFFAYPDKPSLLHPKGCIVHTLASLEENGGLALSDLATAIGATNIQPLLQTPELPAMPNAGKLTVETLSTALAHLMPENAIIVDESITAGRDLQEITRGCPKHDWLQICGGSIGDGFPLATGAAIACPQRKVIALQADGSGMYTLQALWTQARESLNITTIIFSNRSYAILKHELKNVRATSGEIANSMMELTNPDLDWVALAAGMGVSGTAVATVTEFQQALKRAIDIEGPYLIEAVL